MQADVQDGSRAVHIGLRDLPWLRVGDVFVAHAGHAHGVFQSLAETVVLQVLLQRLAKGGDLRQCLFVDSLKRTCGRDLAVEILMGQHHGTVDEVAENCHQLGIVAHLEVLPTEIIVLGLRGVGRKHITQDVLLSGEILEILVGPDSPAARSRYLVAFEIQELVGRDVIRKDVAVAIGLEHRREHYAVEDDIVLTDEVDELRILALPPLLPVVREQLLSVADIADGGVKPDIENLAFGALDGNRHTPVKVTGDRTGLQAAVEPALNLAIDIGPPLFVAIEYPLAQPLLIVLQRQIPVGGFFLDRLGAAQLRLWIDKLFRAESAAALLALVAVGVGVSALGASTDNIAVGEESLSLRIIVLLGSFGDKLSRIVEPFEKLGCCLFVNLRGGTSVDIEVYAETLEGFGDYLIVFVDYILRRAALLAGLDGNRHSVFVAAAHK